MRSDLEQVLKPRALKKYQDSSEVLKAPLSVLSFLSESQVRKLRAAKIATVGDLVSSVNDSAPSTMISVFPPGWLEKLLCALFGPQHDRGPNCSWTLLFQHAPLGYYINFPGNPFHTRFGPVFYRGRLDGTARVLVIGQDPATDETLAERVFVGNAGQLAQNYLTKLGLTRSYVMFNTFLFGGQSGSLTSAMATDATIMAYRNSLFDFVKATSPLTCILAFGLHAQTSAANWPGRGSLPVIGLTHPTATSGVATSWNSNFAAAHSAIAPDSDGSVNSTPYSTTSPLPMTDVPRRDLPFGLPTWHGTGGVTRSQRVSGSFETQITWTAP